MALSIPGIGNKWGQGNSSHFSIARLRIVKKCMLIYERDAVQILPILETKEAQIPRRVLR